MTQGGVRCRPQPRPRVRPLKFGLGVGPDRLGARAGPGRLGLAGFAPLLVILAALGLIALGAGILIVGNGGPHEERVLLAVLTAGAGSASPGSASRHALSGCAAWPP